jgi:hypothetical protein
MPEFSTTRPLDFLLVEDDDDHALIVERNLKREPFLSQIHRVRDGIEALQYLQQELAKSSLPDVILLDLKMPRKDGHQVLAEIKENEKLRPIPVIILTTSDAEIDKEQAYRHYVNSYLVKPMERDRFQKMLLELNYYWGVWNKTLQFKPKIISNQGSL